MRAGAAPSTGAAPEDGAAADGETRTYTSGMPWFPDAFGGPMEEALAALHEGRAGDIDGAGHVALLNVLDCLYRSASERKVVTVT